MDNRSLLILSGYATSAILLLAVFIDNYSLVGALLGFLTGIFNFQWLQRDSKRIVDKDLKAALLVYYKSLFSRLGMITLVVAAVGTFRPEWLLYLAVGIAGGICLPLAITMIKQHKARGGEK